MRIGKSLLTFPSSTSQLPFWYWLTLLPGRLVSLSRLDWQLIVWGPSGAVLLQQCSWWCWVSYAVLTGVQPVQAISEVATHTVRGSFTDSTLAKYYACTASGENDPPPCQILINSQRGAWWQREHGKFSSLKKKEKKTLANYIFNCILLFIIYSYYLFFILLLPNSFANEWLNTHNNYLVVQLVLRVSSCAFAHFAIDVPQWSTVIGDPISHHHFMWVIWASGWPPCRLSLSLPAHI